MKKIFFVVIMIVLILLSGCKLATYHQSTCGYHMSNNLNFQGDAIYLKSFYMYPKPKKNAVEISFLLKGDYSLYYYHCNGPIDASIYISNEQSGNSISSLDFSLKKEETLYFSVPENGNYKFEVKSSDKWFVYFMLLFDKNLLSE